MGYVSLQEGIPLFMIWNKQTLLFFHCSVSECVYFEPQIFFNISILGGIALFVANTTNDQGKLTDLWQIHCWE